MGKIKKKLNSSGFRIPNSELTRGSSLIEVVVSIAIMGITTVGLLSCILVGYKINVKADTLMQQELAVTAAAEQVMAEGIETGETTETITANGLEVEVTVGSCYDDDGNPVYSYPVTLTCGDVAVTTYVRQINS